MTALRRSRSNALIKLVCAALLIVGALALAMSAHVKVAEQRSSVTEPPSSMFPELVTYGAGYLVALTLTGAAFALVHWRWAPPTAALAIVFSLALIQIIVHFRCFLHVTLRGPSRDDLQLILFSTLIVLLMVGGTLVVLFNLQARMM